MIRHSPTQIWDYFKTLFPDNAKDVKTFKEFGSNSIILQFNNGNSLIFTLFERGMWRLEPYRKSRR